MRLLLFSLLACACAHVPNTSAPRKPVLDANGDGVADAIVDYGYRVELWLGGEGGPRHAWNWIPPVDVETSAAPGDFDGDGLLDVALFFAGGGHNRVEVHLGSEQAPFSRQYTHVLPRAHSRTFAGVGDIDADGVDDYVVAGQLDACPPRRQSYRRRWRLWASRDFEWRRIRPKVGPRPDVWWVGDIDGNGRDDFIATTFKRAALIRSADDGFIQEPITLPNATRWRRIVADFDGDGDSEMLLLSGASEGYADGSLPAGWHAYGWKDGAFAKVDVAAFMPGEAQPETVIGADIGHVGDLDRDGSADFAAVASERVHVWQAGKASGSFPVADTELRLCDPPTPQGDLNADGYADGLFPCQDGIVVLAGGPETRVDFFARGDPADGSRERADEDAGETAKTLPP